MKTLLFRQNTHDDDDDDKKTPAYALSIYENY